ncbi:lipopolysaccharide biosynthesis protein [Zestomonas thermotolerans]|uniref:lipopolysaccharide biosynthesis protein n=1 Tax=Zestomonas thermotolerans TaxID=157784 RepID=UPI000684888B|nr:lipopolysaccharide biosynthesis protein [Pseudomonas thermotolerans]
MSNKHLYESIIRSMLGRYSVYVANLLSLIILARIFTPDVFGTVAAVTVFFVFFQLMAEAGLGPAIINLKKLKEEDRDGLFGLTIAVGFLLAVLFASMAPVLVSFYQLPRIDEVVPYVAVSLFFFSGTIVPNALLQRDLAFFKIANGGLISELVSTTAAIVLLQIFDPLHALASKAAFSAGALFMSTWYFAGKTEFGRPFPGKKFSAIKQMLSFSGYQFGFNLVNYFSRNLDSILVGKYLGAVMLGNYDKAYQLMKYPLMLLTFAMTPAIQPVIRQHADDYRKVESIHRKLTFNLSLLGAAAGVSMYVLADWVVLMILGMQWLDVIPIIKVLSIAIPAQVVMSTSGSFFHAMNRADLLFSCGLLSAVTMVGAIVLGVIARDIGIICWGLVVAFHINFIYVYFIMHKRIFHTSCRKYFVRMIPAAIVVVGMVGHAIYF